MIARFNEKKVKNENGLTLLSSTDHDKRTIYVRLEYDKFVLEKSFQNTIEGNLKKDSFLKSFKNPSDLEKYFKKKMERK